MKEILAIIIATSNISSLQIPLEIGVFQEEFIESVQMTESPMQVEEYLAGSDREEILWLARLVYSETKRPEEMKLVAWVARNRVELGYKGSNYREVANSKYQFSGLNRFDAQYWHNINMDYTDTNVAWKEAIKIANEVYYADGSERPFPETVKHFYSPISMNGKPSWAQGKRPYKIVSGTSNSVRFAFYDGVR